MAWWHFGLARDRAGAAAPEARSIENPAYRLNSDEAFAILSGGSSGIPAVSIESALTVLAFSSGVNFLSRLLGSLPLNLRRKAEGHGYEPVDGPIAIMLDEAPNAETTSFDWRRLMWQNVFTFGRGVSWIERKANGDPAYIWGMNPEETQIERIKGRKLYHFRGQRDPYSAADVIDIPWMLKADGVSHRSPVRVGRRALGLAMALDDYAARMFTNGGVPPLTVDGPPATGPDAMKRALRDIWQSVKIASEQNIPLAQLPTGFKLNKIGINPDDMQLIEGRKFAVVEISRLLNLPPNFLQDLERSTFSNIESQDLQLVKHTVLHWVVAFEQEMNLKLFGPRSNRRSVKHNLDGIMRGDFKSRVEALARGVQSGIYKPDEARGYMDLPPSGDPKGGQLFMQGATVPLGDSGNSGSVTQ
ncbi:MAG: phage portal protein [Sphingopyxis sp.]